MRKMILNFVLWFLLVGVGYPCSPGRHYGYRNHASKELIPLRKGQFVPNLSENTIGASGPKEGKILPGSPAFHNLVQNYNTMIVFSDKHGYGRLMTQRCKDRVDTLAMLVVNIWPTVKLRVTRGWSDAATGSLHQEGRAVDITTSDRDKKKYGMLARLAVEAGFDWVHYESRFFVHASVRSDKSGTTKYGGCFPADSFVYPKHGKPIPVRALSVGDRVLARDRSTGQLVHSEVIMMMDKMMNASAEFLEIKTESALITLSKQHILFVARRTGSKRIQSHLPSSLFSVTSYPVHAKNVKPGDFLFVHKSNFKSNSSGSFTPSRVESIRSVVRKGVFAPLTIHGTIVVDRIIASCYSSFYSETVAHAAFWPAREFDFFKEPMQQHGVHWYPKFLSGFAEFFLPSSVFRF